MAVETVHAFKAGDGTCHEDKQAAYTADIVHMFRTLPLSAGTQPTAKEFKKLLRAVKSWVRDAEVLKAQMDEEEDIETKRSITGQG